MVNAARRLTTAEASARLGVKVETLYAYVSRGVLTRERSGAGSTFDAREVEQLAQAARARRSAGGERPMAFVTELTLIEDGHLYYRGRDAVALAATASFSSVAEWLWTAEWSDSPPGWEAPPPEAVRSAGAAVRALPPGATTLARLSAVTVAAGSSDPMRHDRSAPGVAAVGRRLLRHMVVAVGQLPGKGVVTHLAEVPAALEANGLPGELLGALGGARAAGAGAGAGAAGWAEAVRAVNAAMVLMADHELAASTLAVRVAASFGADPYAAVLSGLGAAGGSRHGGASVEVHRMLAHAERDGGAQAVGTRLARGPELAGFGMPLYPSGDPRGTALLAIARSLPAAEERRRALESVLDAVRGREIPPPNCDLGLGALAYLLELGSEAGEAIFVLGRTAGWLAHAAEEYGARTSFRVRAAYTGLRPGAAYTGLRPGTAYTGLRPGEPG